MIQPTIVIIHRLQNRVRFKLSLPLRDEQETRKFLTEYEGINDFEYNAITRSIVVKFNGLKVELNEIIMRLSISYSKQYDTIPINVFIGKKVRIFPHLRMETQDGGSVIIHDDVVISQNVHITSAGHLEIGKSALILANVFITNIDHDYTEIGKHVVNQKITVKNTKIGDHCFIGMGAAIMAGTTLGKQCVVGANSVVRGSFPDYCVIVGAPAKIVKQYNPQTQVWEKTEA